MRQIFNVQNMKCGGCVSAVKKALEALDEVESVDVDLDAGKVTVEGDFDVASIAGVITAAGYPAEPAD